MLGPGTGLIVDKLTIQQVLLRYIVPVALVEQSDIMATKWGILTKLEISRGGMWLLN